MILMKDISVFITNNEALLLGIIGVLLFLLIVVPHIWKFIKRKQYYHLMKRSGIKDIDRMKGYQFEEYLKVLFKELGYRPAVTTPSACASMFFYKANEAWVVTNSCFTKQAKVLAKACGVTLLNRYELEKFIVRINADSQPKQFVKKGEQVHE